MDREERSVRQSGLRHRRPSQDSLIWSRGFGMGSNPRDGLRGLRRTLISPPDFSGGGGILYYGLFKPTDPYELTDGVWIVPSGWEMLSLPIGVVGRGTRSHFVVPDDWKVETAWQAFRDWVAFDSFLFMHYAAINYDNNLFSFQDVTYRVGDGSIGDVGDTYNAF